jgi:hypothetical protein
VQVPIPICRIAPAIEATGYSYKEVQDSVEAAGSQNVFWFPGKPKEESPEFQLFVALTARGLLIEPFSRASIGLHEVFGEQKPIVQ